MTDPCSERGLTIVRRIQRIGNRLIHQRDDDLKALDLTSNQSAIILFVARNPGCQINDVRDHLEVTHQAACGLVDRMRSKGILDVRVSDEDARAKRVSLTEEGRRLHEEIVKVGGGRGMGILRGMTDEEVDELCRLLDRIEENMGR